LWNDYLPLKPKRKKKPTLPLLSRKERKREGGQIRNWMGKLKEKRKRGGDSSRAFDEVVSTFTVPTSKGKPAA